MSRYLKDETIKKIVDSGTGEIIEETESKRYRRQVTQDMFYFSFIKTVDFEDILSKTELRLLAQLNKHSQFNTNEVAMTKALRDFICNTMGIKYQSLINAMSSLKKKGIIEINKGVVFINPHFHWKGELKERDDMIRILEIEYDIVEEHVMGNRRISIIDKAEKGHFDKNPFLNKTR